MMTGESAINSDCVVLVLTYRGIEHLKHLLPTLETARSNTGQFNIDLWVVDNGSDKETEEFVKQHFSGFNYYPSPVNDYLFSLNHVVEKVQAPFTFILNDDMMVDPELFNHTLPILAGNKDLFAVTCRIVDWDDTYTVTGVRFMEVLRGWRRSAYGQKDEQRLKYTLYAGGGAAVFNTKKFNQLEGFDPLFRPAYCEDLALSHLAWHQGWPVVYQPAAKLFHREGGTIHDQYKKDRLTRMVYNHQILWMVACAKGNRFLLWFLLLLPWRLFVSCFQNKNTFFSWVAALRKLPVAIRRRKKIANAKLDDLEIVDLINQPYENKTVRQ